MTKNTCIFAMTFLFLIASELREHAAKSFLCSVACEKDTLEGYESYFHILFFGCYKFAGVFVCLYVYVRVCMCTFACMCYHNSFPAEFAYYFCVHVINEMKIS